MGHITANKQNSAAARQLGSSKTVPKWLVLSLALRIGLVLTALTITVWFGLFQRFDSSFGFPEYLRGYGDRYLHMAAFGCLTFLVCAGRPRFSGSLLVIALLATGLEAAQLAWPGRSATLLDLYASLAGTAFGGVLSACVSEVLKFRSRKRVTIRPATYTPH